MPAETVPAETVPAETVPAETVPAETVPAETVPAEGPSAKSIPAVPTALSEREQQILVFERQLWAHAGAKEAAIRAEFDLPVARYYQLLNVALDRPEAIAFDPLLVRRLQRLRDARTDARSARVLGTSDSTHQ
ncbi:DUF3263 domain-containing protein [Frigoribacterium sp. CG_9.8]|uniref:DUF3263 domain-containing protein n=1 Tax=Frigoribacterium sp. CG_9.8 TaxID=2787733 RepID=UPI001A324FF6|nr:hypothetical protein [Frigoribacterium sp. CG_9.8]